MNATQTISAARAILAMDFLAVDEKLYAQVLSELEDLRFGIADLQTADEVKMAVDVADEVGEILKRAARH
jgi:hypothetical protein